MMNNTGGVFFRTYGSGKPVIMLHGFLGCSSQWVPIAKNIKGYTFFIPDLPNHGNSVHTPALKTEDVITLLAPWISSLGISSSSILVGHSYGGKIAVELVKSMPDFFEKLILIDSLPFSIPLSKSIIKWIDVMENLNLSYLHSYSEVKDCLIKNRMPQREIDLLMKNIKNGINGLQWKSNVPLFLKSYKNLTDEIELSKKYTIPVYLLRGENSEFMNESMIKKLIVFFPLLKDIVIPNAGHWIQMDNPGRFIKEFIRCINE